ncbi:hypothetical protein A6R68_05730 [Neotoma lepida]|uniref:CHY-type domain-containing protein n=1 Tax=Neotoma lepida TaxID=56216 RepID=A0A1A6GJ06_NEOLE|nr:hypothetical protein A6R68_05730 [Neotoma lepida]
MAATAREDGVRSLELGQRGCKHYDGGCLLKAPCCDKLYTCRLCHDNIEDHQLDRFKVKEVQCVNCEKIQHAQQTYMTRDWRQLDNEVAQTPMPLEYQNVTVDILCNDCNGRSTVQFHILGMKCKICDSYNTAQAGGRRVPVDQQ